MDIKTACALARIFARHNVGFACRLLMNAGLSLNDAAHYVFSALRAARVQA